MSSKIRIPHLEGIASSPFLEIEKRIIDNQVKIESWFRDRCQHSLPVLTASVDLRNAGFKIAVVDTNLFPAGFNNLNQDFLPLCIQAFKSAMNELYPHCQKILILPENHTRNVYYYESLLMLFTIVQYAGYEVKIGSLLVKTSQTVHLKNKKIILHPLQRKENKLVCEDFIPCMILLNNDLSEGIPSLLEGISQPIEPPPHLGWSKRSKASHFHFYQEVCQEFSELIGIDPWQISPLFLATEEVNFLSGKGLDCLMEKSSHLLNQIQKKYNEYNIEYQPYLMIKADAGTYGMAVMPLQDPSELINLNRKQRLNMSVRKGKQAVNRFILQEGIPTFETIGKHQAVTEPVVYMLGQHVVGGFYRVHQSRKFNENLNSPGMHFEKLAFSECCNIPDNRLNPHHLQNQFYIYSVIARLGLLAATKEKLALI